MGCLVKGRLFLSPSNCDSFHSLPAVTFVLNSFKSYIQLPKKTGLTTCLNISYQDAVLHAACSSKTLQAEDNIPPPKLATTKKRC